MSQQRLKVTPNGITAIYSDDLISLSDACGGDVSITRASFVEPNDAGLWFADMSPSGGPILGPYRLRSDALSAETAWLEAKLFR